MVLCFRRILITGMILLWPGAAGAQQTAAPAQSSRVTLDELISEALAANRRLKIARLQETKARDDAGSARARQYPNFDVQLFSGPISSFDFTFQPGAFGNFPATGPVPPTETKVNKAGSW